MRECENKTHSLKYVDLFFIFLFCDNWKKCTSALTQNIKCIYRDLRSILTGKILLLNLKKNHYKNTIIH